jgi:hypothetical protein
LAFLGTGATPDGRWLAPLLARMEADPGLGAAGPQRLSSEGAHLPANVAMTWAALAKESLPSSDPPPLALALDGLVVRADALSSVGGLDEAFQDRWAEVDLCFRLCESGRRIAQVAESLLPLYFPFGGGLPAGPADDALLAQAWRARVAEPPLLREEHTPVELVARERFMETAAARITPCDVLLDIGCGIRPQRYVVPRVHICCEPFGQYIERLQASVARARDRQHVLLKATWEQAVELFLPGSVDSVFLLDVIEHLEKERALELLRRTERLARQQVVVFTTLGFVAQHHPSGKDAWGLDGASWQEHRSGFRPEDFGDGWETLVAPDFHTHDNLNRPYDVPRGAMWAIHNKRARPFRVNRVA